MLSDLQTGNMWTGQETWWTWLWYHLLSMGLMDNISYFPANRSLPELLWQQWSMFLLFLIEWVQIFPWVESEKQPCIQRSGAVIRRTHIHISYGCSDRQEWLRDTHCCADCSALFYDLRNRNSDGNVDVSHILTSIYWPYTDNCSRIYYNIQNVET